MTRIPIQVLVIPYTQNGNQSFRFGVLCRSDGGQWQGVAGGVEDGETAYDAAFRESREELGLESPKLIRLTAQTSIPAYNFPQWNQWKQSDPLLYVIPEISFGLLVPNLSLVCLSNEHSDIVWLSYHEAMNRYTWDSNKTALWELNERLADLDKRFPLSSSRLDGETIARI
jgi:dATP pyrophosphohydrolase